MRDPNCEFCKIINGEEYAEILMEWVEYNVIAMVPLNPVVPFHTLILPKNHVSHALTEPHTTATVMLCACLFAGPNFDSCNIITSVGRPATQTIDHLHIHVVPRSVDDGLCLPWTKETNDGSHN